MLISVVRELYENDLRDRIDEVRIALDQSVLNNCVSPLDSPADIKKKRLSVARLLSQLRQRELKK
ncbi:MAG: 50S ribosomal protein L29 [Dysgonomonas sp.]